MTDYSDYVHCGEVFRSSILSNAKPYLFKCIKCQDLFQLEAFLTHSQQNLCDLREITIKVLDDGWLSACSKRDSRGVINSNSIDEIGVNQVGCLKKDSLVFKNDVDVSNADEKDHVRYKIESSDAEVDAEQQEFETDVCLDNDFGLDDDKYDSEDAYTTDEYESLVKRKQGNEDETMYSRNFVSNFMEDHDNVMALIEAYKAQTPLWNRRYSLRDNTQRKYLENVTKDLNQKRKLDLHWRQVSSRIKHLLRNYMDDLKQFKDSQKQKTTYRRLWYSEHMQFLQPVIENKFLAILGPHLPSLLQEQVVQVLKIYEDLPHLWNTSIIEYRWRHKRCESEMEMIKRIEATLGYKIDCKALKKYLLNIRNYFFLEKRRAQNDEHLVDSELYQHLVFLLDHVGPFRCSQCDFTTDGIFHYKAHISQHDGSIPFKCSQCGKEFKTKSQYNIHAHKLCSNGFDNKAKLIAHLNVREFICKICGITFKTTHRLRRHNLIHSDLRKYVCTICSNSYKLRSQLKRHLRTHGGNLNDDKTTTSEDNMADTEIIVKDNLNYIL